LIHSNAILTCGTFKSSAASAKVMMSPTSTGRHGTARRFSLISQARPMMATMPSADWSDCIER